MVCVPPVELARLHQLGPKPNHLLPQSRVPYRLPQSSRFKKLKALNHDTAHKHLLTLSSCIQSNCSVKMDRLGHEDPSAKGGNVCSDTCTVFKEEEMETQPHNDSNVAEMLKVSASLK